MRFQDFKKIAYGISNTMGASASTFTEAGVTPNFHACCIQKNRDKVYLLCSENDDWAISRDFNAGNCELCFEDREELSGVLLSQFKVYVLRKKILDGPFEARAFMFKSDISYWKPKTLGEALFNWWD